MLPLLNATSTPHDRLRSYRELAPVPRILLEILALAHTPLDQASLFSALRAVFQKQRAPLDRNSQSVHLSALLLASLAVKTREGHYHAHPLISADVAASSSLEGRSTDILPELRKVNFRGLDHFTKARQTVWQTLFNGNPDGHFDAVMKAEKACPGTLVEIGLQFRDARSPGALNPNIAYRMTLFGIWEAVLEARDVGALLQWLRHYVEFTKGAYPFLDELVQAGELMGYPGGRSPEQLKESGHPRLKLLLAAAAGDQSAYLAMVKKRTDRSISRQPLENLLTAAAVMRYGKEHEVEKLLWDDSNREGSIAEMIASAHFGLWGRNFDFATVAPGFLPEPYGRTLFLALGGLWLGKRELLRDQLQPLTEAASAYRKARAFELAKAAEELARRARGEKPEPHFLVDAFRTVPEGQRRYQAFVLWAGARQAASAAVTERMVWEIEHDRNRWNVTPRVQKRNKSGDWSSGKALQLHQAVQKPPTCCDAEDKRTLEAAYANSLRGGSHATLDEWALLHLVDHPRVFFAKKPSTPVQVRKAQPALRVVQEAQGLRVRLEPALRAGWTVQVHQAGPDRVDVMQLSAAQLELLKALGGDWIEVPEGQEEAFQDLLGTVAIEQVRLESDLCLRGAATSVAADTTLRLRLFPSDLGLAGEILARPFGDWGPITQPGQGGKVMVAEREGETFQVERDLPAEGAALARLRELFPPLAVEPLAIPSPLDCLELLEALREAPEGLVRVEWPDGETFKVKWRGDLQKIVFTSRSEQDWLEIEGTLTVSDEQVLSLQQLLEMASQSTGRFLALGQGEFLALTQEFRDRLDRLARLGEPGKKGRLRLNSLAATVAAPELMIDDPHWAARRQRMAEAEKLKPRVPTGFLAELRPYQRDGLNWMSRLAHWGAGACLADDMGLGKTIQALALLLRRAKEGPALVVAPTSVCANWVDEAARFAPGLRVRALSDHDREEVLAAPGPFDLVLCSYGLLVNELERLQKISWSTLVLDEAQAIKNSTTHRFKAAVALNADFRLATTGTPIENNLEELWSLFRFLNPGLLGGKKSFDSRFARAISVGDQGAQETLRRLVHPFVLRRLKGQVLKELPPKTEITLAVSLSEPEMALYEGLRREAVEAVAAQSENRLFVLLTHMTKLRRACCHPLLALPSAKFGSSKLEMLAELVGELKANGHRALIFSQFVDHLTLVRARLDSLGMTYRYLDGKTPEKKRREEVRAFQAGESDFFLISLKAGGVGLNLTAADYVIHLDPWWNPAVEDQASDRAHRMGQQRPVTVYRLVASGTIEQKIVALHESKRDLADRLLEGTDKVSKLDADELAALLTGTRE